MVAPSSAIYRTKTYTVFPGNSVNDQLPLIAVRVRVDNPGGMWVNIVDAEVTCPPFTIGWIVALPAIQIANITTTPPQGQTPLISAASQPATVIYSDDIEWVPSPGSPANVLQNEFSSSALTVCAPFNSVVNLTFPANSVKVDNPGGQWVTITVPGNVWTVPPWTIGVVIPLPTAQTSVTVSTTPPTGQFNTGGGSCATVGFTEQMLPASSGLPAFVRANSYAEGVTAVGPGVADNNPGVVLGFQANSILIVNAGGQWVDVFDGVTFQRCPPWTANTVIPCPRTVANARFRSNSPPANQFNLGQGDAAQITWTEQILPATPGEALQPILNNGYLAVNQLAAPNTADNNPGVALGFRVNSVIIDNAVGQWLEVFDGIAFRRIAPWTIGAVLPCPQTVDHARFRSNNPPSGQQNTAAGDANAVLTWTQQILPFSNGIQLAPVLALAPGVPAVALINSIAPAAATTTFNVVVNIPAGTWYFRRIQVSCMGSMGVSVPANIIVLSTANITGSIPNFECVYNGGGGVAINKDLLYGIEYKFTATAGATITYVVTSAFGANFAALTQNIQVNIDLIPVNT